MRDEAKMLGGLGKCGFPICCQRFLPNFSPVSIKMAKEQNISLNPNKISGLCGRLMCCLNYEQDHYALMRSKMPRVGSGIDTVQGPGTVQENNYLTGMVKVRVERTDGNIEIIEVPFEKKEPETENDVPAEAVPENRWEQIRIAHEQNNTENAPAPAQIASIAEPAKKRRSNRRRRHTST